MTDTPPVEPLAPSAPGYYRGMPNKEYQARTDAISKSMCDDVRKAPRYYWHRRLNPAYEAPEKSEALIMGDRIDNAVLEPDRFNSRFVRAPADAPTRPAARSYAAKNPSQPVREAMAWWRDFAADHPGREVISADDYKVIEGCRDAVHTHPYVKNLARGEVQGSYFAADPRTGALVKCRPDVDRMHIDGLLVDLKSTIDASPEGFAGSITKFRYHVQDPHYRSVVEAAYGERPKGFAFIAVEKTPPHMVGLYYVHEDDVADGLLDRDEDIDAILACQTAGVHRDAWPDYGFQPNCLRIRPYARRSRRFSS